MGLIFAWNQSEGGLPPVARSGSGERRVVDQNSASWNRILSWLGEVDRVRLAAA